MKTHLQISADEIIMSVDRDKFRAAYDKAIAPMPDDFLPKAPAEVRKALWRTAYTKHVSDFLLGK